MKYPYRREQIEAAKIKISEELPDKDVLNGQIFQQFYGTTITNDFTQNSMKRISVVECTFLQSILVGVAGTGSNFTKTRFTHCDLSGANFQYCCFRNVIFDETTIRGANFSHSVFLECRFERIDLIESTLYDCYFEDCVFTRSTIRTDTFESTTLRHSSISCVDLAHINIEYMRFDDVSMHDVILPPYQVPYIIGAPACLKNPNNAISIYTDNGNLSASKYLLLFDDLAMYFDSMEEYFPLSNLLIAMGMHEEAYSIIKMGIQQACDRLDFRMIKHYCRLACSDTFYSHSQLKLLYDLITGISYSEEWDIVSLHSFMLNIGEIREILLNNSEQKQRVEFVIKTDIDKDNLNAINHLYNRINSIIAEYCSSSHINAVELRHNSPYELYVTCIDTLPNIIVLISAMYGLLSLSRKGLGFGQEIASFINTHLDNKLKRLEIEEKKLEVELKKKQLRSTNSPSCVQTYTVTELEHFIKCKSIEEAKTIPAELLHNHASLGQQ